MRVCAACMAMLIGAACTEPPPPEIAPPQPDLDAENQARESAVRLVSALSFESYKRQIETLSDFGDRRQGSESFDQAFGWLEQSLVEAGYTPEHHDYEFRAEPRQSLYVTKIGSISPDTMYMLSAHLDGLGYGGAADDDGSGVALVLEAALAFAPAQVRTDTSIRFVFWNNEETGLVGSRAYAAERAGLQGLEDPPGSGRYPEPVWLGVIQHDMLLFDHGVPPGPDQIAGADIDIEFARNSRFALESSRLADFWQISNAAYSSDYPAEVGNDMRGTDSVSFRDETAAISIRENKRSELEAGANPNWHQVSDRYATYADEDFRLGFNALQMTVGAVAELAGASLETAEQRDR